MLESGQRMRVSDMAQGLKVQNDQLHGVSKSDVEESTEGVTHIAGDRLGSKGQQAGEGYDSNAVHSKDDPSMNAGDLGDGDADGDKDKQDIEPAVSNGQAKAMAHLFDKCSLGLGFGGVGGIGILNGGLYERPLPLNLRRWSGWEVTGRLEGIGASVFLLDIVVVIAIESNAILKLVAVVVAVGMVGGRGRGRVNHGRIGCRRQGSGRCGYCTRTTAIYIGGFGRGFLHRTGFG